MVLVSMIPEQIWPRLVMVSNIQMMSHNIHGKLESYLNHLSDILVSDCQSNCSSLCSMSSCSSKHCTIPSIICLQEIWLQPSSNILHIVPADLAKIYSVTALPHSSGRSGLVVLALNHISLSRLSNLEPKFCPASHSMMCIYKATVGCKVFVFGNIYLWPNGTSAIRSADRAAVLSSLSSLQSLNLPFVITGDFNARHPDWCSNSAVPNDHGRWLHSVLDNSDDLFVLNSTLCPLIPTHQSGNCIDLTLCNSSSFVECMLVADHIDLDSDHFPLIINVSPGNVGFSSAGPRLSAQHNWVVSKANWTLFQDYFLSSHVDVVKCGLKRCHKALASMLISNSVVDCQHTADDLWSEFERAVSNACDSSIPIAKPTSRSLAAPWWSFDNNLTSFKHRYLHLTRLSRRPNQPATSKADASMAKNDWRNAVRKAKRAYFSSEVKKIPRSNAADYGRLVWKVFHNLSGASNEGSSIASICHPDTPNVHPKSHQTSVNNMSIALERIFDPVIEGDDVIDKQVNEFMASGVFNSTHHALDSMIVRPRMLQQLSYLIDADTAPGPDGLPAAVLRQLPGSCLAWLSQLFNFFYRSGVIPNKFRVSRVTCLYKGKGLRSAAASYRPISISSVFYRLYEHVINVMLKIQLGPNFLSSKQFGFRRHHRTHHQIAELVERILSTFRSRAWLPAVFIDIRRAFDTISHPHLLFKLHRANVSGNVLRSVKSMLSKRTFFVQDGHVRSQLRSAKFGTPQGGVVSPLLFNVFINSAIISAGCEVVVLAYADDLVVLPAEAILDGKGKSIIDKMQAALHRLTLWAKYWRMEFSKEKSQIVVFSKRKLNSSITPPCLFLSGFCLSIVDSYTYLGYPLSKDLSWKKLYDQLLSTINSRNFLINRVISLSCPRFPIVRLLSLSFSRSAVTYFLALAKFSDQMYESFDSKLLRPLRTVLNVPRYTRTSAFQAECGVAPVKLSAKLSLISHTESLLDFSSDYFQSRRLYNELSARSSDDNSRLKSYTQLALSYSREFGLQVIDLINSNRLRFDPVKKAALFSFSQSHACALTRLELACTKRKFPMYLACDPIRFSRLRVRLRLNVSKLNDDLSKHMLSFTRQCQCGDPIQNADHIIMSCRLMSQFRQIAFRKLDAIGVIPTTELFLGHVVDVEKFKQSAVLNITGHFLSSASSIIEL